MDEKYKVIITPEAQEDIRNSIRYIARELANPQAAMALQEELRKEITSLETMPLRKAPRPRAHIPTGWDGRRSR